MASTASIPALVRQLRGSRRVAQLQAAQALGTVAAEMGRAAAAEVVAVGGMPPLLGMLSSGSDAAQQVALRALFVLGRCSAAARDAMLSAGVAPMLVQLLRNSSAAEHCKVHLPGTLLSMLGMLNTHGGPEVGAAIVAAGAAPLLVSLLTSQHETVQQAAAAAIGSLTWGHSAPSGAALVDAGAVQALVDCLSSSSDLVLPEAANALANLTGCEGLARASLEAARAGAMPRLVPLLGSNDDLRESAALTLGNIAADLQKQPQHKAQCKAVFLAAGAVPATARLLSQPGSVKVQAAAASIVGLLACDDAACCVECVAAGMVPSLQRLLSSEGAEVRSQASEALQLLAVFSPEALAAVKEARLAPCLIMQRRPVDAPRSLPASRSEDAAESSSQDLGAAGTASLSDQPGPASTAQQQPTQRPTRVCAAEGCGATRGLRSCGGCHVVRYCSEACSHAHWRAHRAECRSLQAAAKPGAALGGQA